MTSPPAASVGDERPRRRYDSPARAAQAERTRDAILAAFADQLGQAGNAEISVPDAARAAAVSVRTVYLHFPDDAARRHALAEWIDTRLGGGEPIAEPTSLDELPALTKRLYSAASRHPDLVRAQAANGFTSPVRIERLGKRRTAIARLIQAIGVSPAESRRATATVQLLMSAEAGLPLVDVHGLSFSEAGQAAAFAVEAVIERLRATAAN